MQPETKYARLGQDRIAYQVLGQGPPDLVLTLNSFGHVDVGWEEPGYALFLRTLASFSRVIPFDRRGTGASDPLPVGALPPWESYGEDLVAVLDEVGSEQAAIMAQLDASPMAIFFAGTRTHGVAFTTRSREPRMCSTGSGMCAWRGPNGCGRTPGRKSQTSAGGTRAQLHHLDAAHRLNEPGAQRARFYLSPRS